MKNLLGIFFVLAVALILVGCKSASPVRISVLGDSYSTYKGWIPEENWYYYPQPPEKNDVSKAEECWWYLVAQDLGGVIDSNESWSGSTVCYRGYNGVDARERSFVNRVPRMGNPDIILICGATNDSWSGASVGEYKWSDWTDDELFTFRPAMAKMLADIQTIYPKAAVYFILNSELRPEINDSVHTICEYYHVPCIDLHDIEKQNGHPSIKGMRAFADQVIQGLR